MKTIKKMQRISAIGRKGIAMSSFKWAIMIAMCVLCTGHAFGQFKIKVGATAGFNFAALVEEDELSDLRTGFRGGAIADFGLHKNFSIAPELLFSQRGWKYIGKDEDEGITQTAKLNYVEMPINLVVKFKVASDVKLILFPGFYVGYAFSAKLKHVEKGEGTKTGKIPLGKGMEEFNPLDMGMNLGIGIEVKSVFFRFQLHPGFKNVSNDPDYSSTNSAVSLSLGYFFN